jgi:hypothetical protein
VLEGVFELREEAGLVEEFRGLQVGERAVQGRLADLPKGLQQQEGHVRADDGDGLQEALLLGWQPIDAGRQHCLHRGRHLDARERLRQAIGTWGAHQDAMFHQRPHALLQKEGVALGACDQ